MPRADDDETVDEGSELWQKTVDSKDEPLAQPPFDTGDEGDFTVRELGLEIPFVPRKIGRAASTSKTVRAPDRSADPTSQAPVRAPARDESAIAAAEARKKMVDQLRALRAQSGIRFGAYWLLGSAGAGGMAEVRLAYEELPDKEVRPCVVKRISRRFLDSREYREMFQEEVWIGRILHHPNIVEMYGAGEIESVPFISFELIDGITAAQLDRVVDPSPVPAAVVVEIGLQVARALGYAHGLSALDGKRLALVHRDVSPQNILISRNGEVKLADFGIARFEGREHETRIGLVKGKMQYLSPEQRRIEPVDGRTDLFSLGIVLAQLTCDGPLFPEGTMLADDVSARIRERLPPERADVPRELVELLARMTEEEREDRPENAEVVLRELGAIQDRLNVGRGALADFLARAVFPAIPKAEERAIASAATIARRIAEAKAANGAIPALSDFSADEGDYPTSSRVFFPSLFSGREPSEHWDTVTVSQDSLQYADDEEDQTRRVPPVFNANETVRLVEHPLAGSGQTEPVAPARPRLHPAELYAIATALLALALALAAAVLAVYYTRS